MSSYTPPPINNIPFKFTSGGYQPPQFSNIPFNFRSTYNYNLTAAVDVMQRYQDSTYTFLKYCEQYVIGHRAEGVQIIKGKCHYGGIRDLGATLTAQFVPSLTIDLGGLISAHDPENLTADIKGIVSTFKDLPVELIGEYLKQDEDLSAKIETHPPKDLSAYLKTTVASFKNLSAEIIVDQHKQTSDLGSLIDTHSPRDIGATISMHPPADLSAKVRIFSSTFVDLLTELNGITLTQDLDLQAKIDTHLPRDLNSLISAHNPENLTASIKGFMIRDLGALLRGVVSRDLSASLNALQPRDLNAYLNIWPQTDLYGAIHGWQETDLSAYVNITFAKNLSAVIGGHTASNLKASVKGYGREVFSDLNAYVHSNFLINLPGSILGMTPSDLTGYLFPIIPKDLYSYVHGWQESDLSAVLNGNAWPWDLPASITSSGGIANLIAGITPITSSGNYRDLSAYILSTKGVTNLTAGLGVYQMKNLLAYIDTCNDVSNLSAIIRPKMIRLTGILSIITMEHSNLSATISIPCFYSDLRELSAYLRPVFLSNLGAIIHGKNWDGGITNLGAKWGYASGYIVQDRLAINVNITPAPPKGYRVEDKLRLYLHIYRAANNLATSIFGELRSTDFPAYIYGVELQPYNFDGYAGREKVYSHTYSQVLLDFEDIAVEFGDIVKDYIYSSGGNVVAKTDRYQHFLTKISSYYSKATSEILNRKLHKVKLLYDLRKFESIDAAIKYAIDYVTLYPYVNIGAYINSIGTYTGITASVTGITIVSTLEDLSSQIEGQMTHSYQVILGFTDDGVGYLQF